MRRLEIQVAIGMLVLSAIAAFGTSTLAFWSKNDFAPGPAFMPMLVAGAGAILSALLIAEAVLRPTDTPVDWPDRTGARRVLATTIALWAFIALLPWLGVLISTALLLLTMLIAIANRPLLPSLATTIVTAGLIQIVFVVWLNVQLPKGVLGF